MAFTAKSVIIDITDAYNTEGYCGIRSIEFWHLGSLIQLSPAEFDAYATEYYETGYPSQAFDTSLPKTGSSFNEELNEWIEWQTDILVSDIRLIVVFNSPVTFDKIVFNNSHDAGQGTDLGVKNILIYTSQNEITNTVYGSDTSNYSLIFAGQVSIHSPADTVDDEVLISSSTSDILTEAPVLEQMKVKTFTVTDDNSKLVYIFTLTGDPDVEIPISSFQSRLRSGSDTYLSVVVPGFEFASDIDDRSDGQMVIEAVNLIDGVIRKRNEVVRVNLSTIRIDEGPNNKKITLTGYRQKTYTPKTVELKNPTYKLLNDGKLRYRFSEHNQSLNPGDTVTISGDSFAANVISYYVAVSGGKAETRMEVSEA